MSWVGSLVSPALVRGTASAGSCPSVCSQAAGVSLSRPVVLSGAPVLQRPINPYGLAKKMAEDIIRDFSKANPDIAVAILR